MIQTFLGKHRFTPILKNGKKCLVMNKNDLKFIIEGADEYTALSLLNVSIAIFPFRNLGTAWTRCSTWRRTAETWCRKRWTSSSKSSTKRSELEISTIFYSNKCQKILFLKRYWWWRLQSLTSCDQGLILSCFEDDLR